MQAILDEHRDNDNVPSDGVSQDVQEQRPSCLHPITFPKAVKSLTEQTHTHIHTSCDDHVKDTALCADHAHPYWYFSHVAAHQEKCLDP